MLLDSAIQKMLKVESVKKVRIFSIFHYYLIYSMLFFKVYFT